MLVVVDASVAAAFVIPAQGTIASARFFDGWRDHVAWAPYVFSLEIRGLLLRRERRTRVAGFALAALDRLDALHIELAEAPDSSEQAEAFSLAQSGNIGFYDAMYIITAAETGAALVSKDRPQLAAARVFGLEVVDLN